PPVRDKVGEAVFESTCGAIHENVENDEKAQQFWLMKAEPESRLEKGVDVKFSIDDLRSARAPEAWDGSLLSPLPRVCPESATHDIHKRPLILHTLIMTRNPLETIPNGVSCTLHSSTSSPK
ncbi:hypothetical protein KEM55_008270, partial [Ascosphaera atra]